MCAGSAAGVPPVCGYSTTSYQSVISQFWRAAYREVSFPGYAPLAFFYAGGLPALPFRKARQNFPQPDTCQDSRKFKMLQPNQPGMADLLRRSSTFTAGAAGDPLG